MAPDNELIGAYAKERSEAAFQALVSRHMDLVFATALRQVGDRGVAEEITQNVFITLARKSPALRGVETLAGWLHRTTVLESKTRIRSELRRKRREEMAATLHDIASDGDSAVAALVPLVDEALLHLPEADRVALVLRYLEDRSLREVGEALGTNEDAARKRVSRALDRITEFFKRRGFAVSAVVTAAALTSTVKAAPGLVKVVTKTSVAAGTSQGLFQFSLLWLMGLSKTQTLVIAIAAAAVPLLCQERAIGKVSSERLDVTVRLVATKEKTADAERRLRQAKTALIRANESLQNVESQTAMLSSQAAGRATIPQYTWDDSSPVMRVPKAFLMGLSIEGPRDRRGQLSETIVEGLQLTETERQNVQDVIDKLLSDYNAALASYTHELPAADVQKAGDKNVRMFEVKASAIARQTGTLIENSASEIAAIIGKDRAQALNRSFEDWVSVGKDYTSLSTSLTLIDFDHRLILTKPEPGDRTIHWEIRKPNNEMVSGSMSFDELPPHIRSRVEDWISLAQSKPAKFNP